MIKSSLFRPLVSCCLLGLSFGQLSLEAASSKHRNQTHAHRPKQKSAAPAVPATPKEFKMPTLEEITYDFLRTSDYTDHVPVFKQLFDRVSIGRMIEFGLGIGTKFFLDHVDHLTSVEIIVGAQTSAWFDTCKILYENYPSWDPVLYPASAHCNWANGAVCEGKNPLLYDATYLLELHKLVRSMTERGAYELAFVDPGIHNRGDLVMELFDQVDIIVAHDTNHPLYQWDRVYTPSNYEKIVFNSGQGVIFWVKKERLDVIEALTGNRNVTVSKQNLRIFFPNLHGGFEEKFLRSLQFLGHTRLYPGRSFDQPDNPYHIGCGKGASVGAISVLPEDLRKTVEVVEVEDLFRNPPDVIFVSGPESEQDILRLYNAIHKIHKNVKLAYYSGNNYIQPVYNLAYCQNILTLDGISERFFKDRHHVRWIPWINCDEFAEPTKTFELGSI